MSWLDLPPLAGPAGLPPDRSTQPGVVLIGLVGAGLVTLWTEFSNDTWRPERPAELAGALGIGEVERADTGDGWAECGHFNPANGQLILRTRNPSAGQPQTFHLTPATDRIESADPQSRWQLRQMTDVAVRREDRWALSPGGYGQAAASIGLETSTIRGQRHILVTARPAELAAKWPDGRLGMDPAKGVPSRTATLPATPPNINMAVTLMVTAMHAAEVESWGWMPTYGLR